MVGTILGNSTMRWVGVDSKLEEVSTINETFFLGGEGEVPTPLLILCAKLKNGGKGLFKNGG